MAERDEKGRFVKGHTQSIGNKGGGRLPKSREERYYRVTISTCTFADWRAIIEKAVDQAKRGDAVARKFLADYLVGVPTQDHTIRGEIGTFDLDAWKERQAQQLEHVAKLEG